MARQQVNIPELREEEKQEADYGHEKLVSHLLMSCAESCVGVDKNKDGLIQSSEYIDVLWRLQLLEGALKYHLDKNFKESYKKSRAEFDKYNKKIESGKLTLEEIDKYNFKPVSPTNKLYNLNLLYRKHILTYYNLLLHIVSRLKFLKIGESL